MKILNSLASAGLMLTLLGAASVRANDITYVITGIVRHISDSDGATTAGSAAVGDNFTLTVVGDPDSPTFYRGVRYPALSARIEFSGGLAGNFDPGTTNILVNDPPGTGLDIFGIQLSGFQAVNGNPFYQLLFDLSDSSGIALSSSNLPATMDINDWSSKRMSMVWRNVVDPHQDGVTSLIADINSIQASVTSGDTDNDGLIDNTELSLGTNPNNPDTDGDGMLDGTEVDLAAGGACPNPLHQDSDVDGLLDGSEVAVGTDPCNPDTDGDGVQDGNDPTPLDPGVPGDYLEVWLKSLADEILGLDLSSIHAANSNAAQGRRNALANRARDAAKALADGDTSSALDLLQSLLARVDENSVPGDWIVGPESETLREEIELLIALIELSSP